LKVGDVRADLGKVIARELAHLRAGAGSIVVSERQQRAHGVGCKTGGRGV